MLELGIIKFNNEHLCVNQSGLIEIDAAEQMFTCKAFLRF